MHAALTVRRLRPGTIDQWRRAWEPDEWQEGWKEAYILRNLENPDEVIAFGFFEGDLRELSRDPQARDQQTRRFERMAEFVESTGADGLYEVVEVVRPSVRAGTTTG